MKNLTAFLTGTLLVVSLSSVAQANDGNISQEIHRDLAQMCEYDEQLCVDPKNGMGKEPPYTPRKPKKQR